MTYGLTQNQQDAVSKQLPSKSMEIVDVTGQYTDIIACSHIAVIIDPANCEKEELETIIELFCEIGSFAEKVVFTGQVKLPTELKHKILVYSSFEEMDDRLKYILLSAYRSKKKASQFSRNISDVLLIVDLIRKNPGIKTKALAERLELSNRSVQRYIETLRVAGEWIDYDRKLKGWYLAAGKSILLMDWW